MTANDRLPVGVLISGRGSNMEALARAAAAPGYPARIAAVIADRADAPGLAIAAALGLPAQALPRADYPTRPAFEDALDAALRARGVRLIALAGFMRILSAEFLARWPDAVVNIHPSLLPALPGLDTHARALAASLTEHGCTVHMVVPEVDAGPILAQARVPVLPGDTPATLAARVLAEEHRLYPQALAAFITR